MMFDLTNYLTSYGDRICPNCGNMSLFESSYTLWRCELCQISFEESELDSCEEGEECYDE